MSLSEASAQATEMRAKPRSRCACGHTDHWHGNFGRGSCEHDGECDCEQFIREDCGEMLEIMRDWWTFDAARRWMNGEIP